MTTAELLGNAALGVLALVVIWGLLQQLGVDIVDWIRDTADLVTARDDEHGFTTIQYVSDGRVVPRAPRAGREPARRPVRARRDT